MAKLNGKRVAMWAGVVSGFIVVMTVVALRDRFAEAYWVWRMDRGDDEQRRIAFNALVRLRSARVVPILLSMLEGEAPRIELEGLDSQVPEELVAPGPGTTTISIRIDPLARALLYVGEPALPYLASHLRGKRSASSRFALLFAMSRIAPAARYPDIYDEAAYDSDFYVRWLATEAMQGSEPLEPSPPPARKRDVVVD